MGLTTLTEQEKIWNTVARRAREKDQAWESCAECLQYHPVDYDGACGDPDNQLPGQPSEFGGGEG